MTVPRNSNLKDEEGKDLKDVALMNLIHQRRENLLVTKSLLNVKNEIVTEAVLARNVNLVLIRKEMPLTTQVLDVFQVLRRVVMHIPVALFDNFRLRLNRIASLYYQRIGSYRCLATIIKGT